MATYNSFTEMATKPNAQAVTSTAETNIVLTGSTPGTNLTLGIPGWSKVFDGKGFLIRLQGAVTTDTTGTATIKTYYSATAAGAKTTQIGTSGASQSLATASTNFCLYFDCIWDSTSQTINGIQYGAMGTTVVALAVLTNSVTSIADISTGVWFQPTVTFSAVTTSATVKITDFSLDVN